MNDVICCIERSYGCDLYLLQTDLTADQIRGAFDTLDDDQKEALCIKLFNVTYGSGESLRFYAPHELETITKATSGLLIKLRLTS